MRTTLDIDDKLLDEVVKLIGGRNKSEALNKLMSDYVKRKRIEELRAMLGKTDLMDNWDELRHMEPR